MLTLSRPSSAQQKHYFSVDCKYMETKTIGHCNKERCWIQNEKIWWRRGLIPNNVNWLLPEVSQSSLSHFTMLLYSIMIKHCVHGHPCYKFRSHYHLPYAWLVFLYEVIIVSVAVSNSLYVYGRLYSVMIVSLQPPINISECLLRYCIDTLRPEKQFQMHSLQREFLFNLQCVFLRILLTNCQHWLR